MRSSVSQIVQRSQRSSFGNMIAILHVRPRLRSPLCPSPRKQRNATGSATIEFAVCLPVIVLLVFGSLEGANMIFLRQAAVQAAYESAKIASRRDSQPEVAERLAREILAARRIQNPEINFLSGNPNDTPSGEDVSVRIGIDSSRHLFTRLGLFAGRQIQATATMQKE